MEAHENKKNNHGDADSEGADPGWDAGSIAVSQCLLSAGGGVNGGQREYLRLLLPSSGAGFRR